MISRRSSGSMRAESAVDPTRSENMTVTWRRSAVSCVFGSERGAGSGVAGAAPQVGDGSEHFSSMPEQDADVLEVLIGKMRKDRDVDAVLSKSAGVLGQAEPCEP